MNLKSLHNFFEKGEDILYININVLKNFILVLLLLDPDS